MKYARNLLLLLALCALTVTAVFAQEASAIPQIEIAINADDVVIPADVPEGIVTVTLANNTEAPADPMIVRLNEGVTQDDFNAALSEGPMAAIPLVHLLGGTMVVPGTSKDITYNLLPGEYAFMQFTEAAPIIKFFTVADAETASAAAPEADIEVKLMDFAFTMPIELPAGEHTWHIANEGEQWHEMAIIPVDDSMTAHDRHELLEALALGGPPEGEDMGQMIVWTPASQGEQAWVNFDLAPGTYLVVCFLPDLLGEGTPHYHNGMVQTITVS